MPLKTKWQELNGPAAHSDIEYQAIGRRRRESRHLAAPKSKETGGHQRGGGTCSGVTRGVSEKRRGVLMQGKMALEIPACKG